MIEFLQMGGYAIYVWPSFAITAVVMVFNVWAARRQRYLAVEEIKRKLLLEQHESQA